MASAVGELGAILRGGEAGGPEQQAGDGGAAAAAAAAAAGKAPGVDISKLSQLSDFADKELQKDDKPAEAQYTQESLLQAAAGNPLDAFQQATQPIPGAVLPDAHAMSQMQGAADPAAAAAAAEEQQKAIAAAAAAAATMGAVGGLPFDAAAQQQLLQSMALMGTPGMLGVDWSHAMAVQHMPEADVEPQPGPRSKSGKPTRRGPMDEMRQLVRILVKLLPQSIGYIGANEEAGGGNRISEEQIKNYLEKTLGEAPRPQWGVPNGWFSYVAELFTWALGRPVDEEQTKKCAKREPGRSWEALEGELAAIGVHPQCWPLPLTLAAVREAEKNPIAQPIPQLPAVKRGGEGVESVGRGRRGGPSVDLDRLTEYELWKHVNEVLNACSMKNGTSPGDVAQQVAGLKSQAKATVDMLSGGGLNMLQYVPVMGLDGNPSMMAFLGGMQGMPMGLPPVTGQLVGADGQLLAPDAAAAAIAAAAAAQPLGDAAAAGAPASDERAAKRARREGEEPTSSTEDEGAGKGKSMSSAEARGGLFGALGAGDATKEAAGATDIKPPTGTEADQQAAQMAQQLPLMYATQPGAGFPMMGGFPIIPGGFPTADGTAQADGTAEGKPEGQA
ncbi:hypothetical protein ABPG75_011231 [Micractinium tetrahymenae]